MSATFPNAVRLTHKHEFRRVFSKGKRKSCGFFVSIIAPNPLGRPRLGVVVSKKVSRRAVDRNALKRCVRESFRIHRAALPAVDVVVLPHRASVFQHTSVLRAALNDHWDSMCCPLSPCP